MAYYIVEVFKSSLVLIESDSKAKAEEIAEQQASKFNHSSTEVIDEYETKERATDNWGVDHDLTEDK